MHLVLSLVVAALGFFTVTPGQPVEVRVDIAPSILDPMQLLKRPTPETYTCNAVVMDDNKQIVGFAKLVAEPGHREITTHTNGDVKVEFAVMIAPAGDRAETKVTVSRSGTVFMRQSSIVRLMNVSGKKYIPLQ